MHVNVSLVRQVANQMVSSLTMAVTGCVCNVCTYNYYDFVVNFHSKDNLRIDFLRLHSVLPKTVECTNCKLLCQLRLERHLR